MPPSPELSPLLVRTRCRVEQLRAGILPRLPSLLGIAIDPEESIAWPA